jgi:hypothetical protein
MSAGATTIATTCPRCAGALRLHSRYCGTVCLECRGCGRLWTQHGPVEAISALWAERVAERGRVAA